MEPWTVQDATLAAVDGTPQLKDRCAQTADHLLQVRGITLDNEWLDDPHRHDALHDPQPQRCTHQVHHQVACALLTPEATLGSILNATCECTKRTTVGIKLF